DHRWLAPVPGIVDGHVDQGRERGRVQRTADGVNEVGCASAVHHAGGTERDLARERERRLPVARSRIEPCGKELSVGEERVRDRFGRQPELRGEEAPGPTIWQVEQKRGPVNRHLVKGSIAAIRDPDRVVTRLNGRRRRKERYRAGQCE